MACFPYPVDQIKQGKLPFSAFKPGRKVIQANDINLLKAIEHVSRLTIDFVNCQVTNGKMIFSGLVTTGLQQVAFADSLLPPEIKLGLTCTLN
jgi:hypothetical protein